jgi:alkylhydroperoxidase family enzyme
MRLLLLATLVAFIIDLPYSHSQSPRDAPRPIPLFRPDMKQMLEDMKQRTPRIPLPDLDAEARATLGERADSYESRLRYHYLGETSPRTGLRGRNPDPQMTLDYAFKVELFWIVSRTNNCQYCLGHQESKLLGAGLSEDRIAGLDGDWRQYSPKEQAAYAFTRRVTLEPHLLGEADIEELRAHFSAEQIVEILISIAWNNAINRWKEGVGVPQSAHEGGYSRLAQSVSLPNGDKPGLPHGSYLTPTSAVFEKTITRVAPVHYDDMGQPTSRVRTTRPALESQEFVLAKFDACRERQPRLPLVSVAETRTSLHLDLHTPVENWMRLLAHFPTEGLRRVNDILEANTTPDLSPLTRAQLNWIVARQDRAWYALERSYRALQACGQTDEQVFALDGTWADFSRRDRALFEIAKDLGASPVMLTDDVVQHGIELAGPAAVVQAINFVTQCAALNRLTEAAGLQADH